MLIVLQPERDRESAAFGEREETCELLERAGEAERAGSRQPDERAWSMGVGSQLRNKEAEITCSIMCRVRCGTGEPRNRREVPQGRPPSLVISAFSPDSFQVLG